jgi:hypothetical protein
MLWWLYRGRETKQEKKQNPQLLNVGYSSSAESINGRHGKEKEREPCNVK